jgi:DNA polymerase
LDCGRLTLWFDGTFLKMQLPSTRCISYPFPREGQGKYSDAVVIFKDAQKGQFKDCNFGHGFWGGAFVENAVQGLGRDILMDAVVRLEEAGYPVVLTIHDEIICEAPEDFGSLQEFKMLVAQRPVWAPELPLAVKVRVGPRLANIDLPVTSCLLVYSIRCHSIRHSISRSRSARSGRQNP